MAYRSPPMPHDMGSMSPMAALVAMAASMALPPLRRISSPTWAASGWLVATMPCGAITTERPERNGAGVNRTPAGRSALDAVAIRTKRINAKSRPSSNLNMEIPHYKTGYIAVGMIFPPEWAKFKWVATVTTDNRNQRDCVVAMAIPESAYCDALRQRLHWLGQGGMTMLNI